MAKDNQIRRLKQIVQSTPVLTKETVDGWEENSVEAKTVGESPWAAAQPAPEFVNAQDAEVDWLHYPLLAPGSITEIFSPRGIGKTHVAHQIAIELAKEGRRVLILDRDNSRREIRRRLKAWGGSDAGGLKVMTRNAVPPLTDAGPWTKFPFSEYDLVMIDSLDASTEGVGEKDSAKPSKAIAPLLDIAHRADGPAILVLGNTTRSGEHSRCSGVVEDRADICFEVRDCTDLTPTGKKPWWEELPPAGASDWAGKATRRKRRDQYRLAFVCTKFRVGEEPDPFIYEIDLAGDSWGLRDVTEEVEDAAQDTLEMGLSQRQEKIVAALDALEREISLRASQGNPIRSDKEGVPFLTEMGMTREKARRLIEEHDGDRWRVNVQTDQRGQPRVLLPLNIAQDSQNEVEAAEIDKSETPYQIRDEKGSISAVPMNIGRRKYVPSEASRHKGFQGGGLFPPSFSGQQTAEPPDGDDDRLETLLEIETE